VDFVTPCVWCELHPDSPFHRQRMIAIKTANGRKTIDGSTFKEFVGEKLVTIQELTDEEIPLYLEEHFGLRV
jgi:N-hydroxyarylamine O-acetyltransferase